MKKILSNKIINKMHFLKSLYILVLCFILAIIFTSCSEKETHEGEVQAPIESSSASGKNYEDIIKQFETAGFKEISTREVPDLITGWLTKDGEVESVSINGDTEYSTSKWFPQDASVVVSYHTFPKKNEKAENEEQKTTEEKTTEEKTTEEKTTEEKTTEEKTTEEKTTEEKTTEEKTTEEKTTEEKTTEEKTTEEKTTEEINKEPIVVDSNNIKNIKVGDYISVTGPAHTMCTSEGKIKVGGNDSGNYAHCGLEVYVPKSENTSYTIQAYKVDPGDYKDTFYNHAPADFSTEPKTVGNLSFSGCRVTITGKVDKILISEELNNFYGLSLGSDSVVEYLELYY